MATLMAARGGVATSSAASTSRSVAPSFSSFRVTAAAAAKNRRRSAIALATSLTTQEQLPASHASQAALEQLRAASAGGINRKFGGKVGDSGTGWRSKLDWWIEEANGLLERGAATTTTTAGLNFVL